MRIDVISCAKYADAWKPFVALMKHFWPHHPFMSLVTDKIGGNSIEGFGGVFVGKSEDWCGILAEAAALHDEPILLMQEDFFINAPVRKDLIQRGLEQMEKHGAGCVRLYPCPGGEEEYGDRHFAIVPRGTRYRISCQAAIWRSDYLIRIASQFNTPAQFELEGSALSDSLPEPVLAFKRDVQPWPLSYICTGIVRGEWLPAAKELCDSLGITDVDWGRRPFAAA